MTYLITLFLTFLLSHPLATVSAKGNIAATYELLAGESSCARSLTLSEDGTSLAASTISADGITCKGGTLSLSPVVSDPTDQLSQVLEGVAVAAGIHLASLNEALMCGDFVVSPQTRIYVIAPQVADVSLPDSDMPALGDLAPSLGEAFAFVEGQVYILFGTECVYMTADGMVGEAITAEPSLGPTCFPADATVTLADGETRRIDELSVGDEVSVGGGETSEVFAWTHRDATSVSDGYVRIVAGENTLTVTPGHFVYANGKALPAYKVRKGDFMRGPDDGKAVVVTDVRRVWAKGLYNPQTVHGDIVVNGFTVTTYTTAVIPEAAHALLAPLRACYAVARAALPSVLVSRQG